MAFIANDLVSEQRNSKAYGRIKARPLTNPSGRRTDHYGPGESSGRGGGGGRDVHGKTALLLTSLRCVFTFMMLQASFHPQPSHWSLQLEPGADIKSAKMI